MSYPSLGVGQWLLNFSVSNKMKNDIFAHPPATARFNKRRAGWVFIVFVGLFIWAMLDPIPAEWAGLAAWGGAIIFGYGYDTFEKMRQTWRNR